MTAYVYFIQAGGDRGPVKIGYSRDVRKRLETLSTGSPQVLALLGAIACGPGACFDAPTAERMLHHRFSALRIDGSEWFRWSQELVDALALHPDRVEFVMADAQPQRAAGLAIRACRSCTDCPMPKARSLGERHCPWSSL
jgi:hypothetical protein